MGLIRYCFIAVVCTLTGMHAAAQKIYYPADASQLLKSTADDMAMLLQKAGLGNITASPYTVLPSDGFIFIYDASVKDNQTCRIKSDGSSYMQFAAAEDNGLNFGVYQYLQQLGFRFYQPGIIWEVIPKLTAPYKKTDSTCNSAFKYKNWFISGGCNKWAMDNKRDFDWDMYSGENGHDWSLYMRRNNMVGAYRFAGHRDDMMTQDFLNTLQNNPCYVAPYNGSRQPSGQSVPDINNVSAMQHWQTAIEQKFTQYKNTVLGNKNIYPNLYHNFSYFNAYIGIEVPDGAHWANSKDASDCSQVDYSSESDQNFTLANYTVSKIKNSYPEKYYQLYAYDGHADVPSAKILIDKNIDIQVVPTAFQNVSSAKGLLSRWYSRTNSISEYHYLNLPEWSGETPSFYLKDLKTTLQRLHSKKAQGIVWQTSPAKFASLPFLLAANANLKDDKDFDNSLHEFCENLFGNGSTTIYQLLQLWGDDKTVMLSNGIQDNKYKLPLYFQLVNKAVAETANDGNLIKERMDELKAYLHYMVLYYDWISDQEPYEKRADKAIALCKYLAQINRMKIVNSYFLITSVVNKYSGTSPLYIQYNIANGTAYKNGALPLITKEEINKNFQEDLILQKSGAADFVLESAGEIKSFFENENLLPLEKINVKINYTYAKDYSARTEFYFIANGAGNVSIQYKPSFYMSGKGYLNFTVEDVNKELGIIKDFSINNNNGEGILNVAVPAAGTYKFSVVSKYKSAVDLEITTNGNYFYKNGPYLGNTIENYRQDLSSLPGYFHVPADIKRIYFSINNSNPGGAGFASPEAISQSFVFKNNKGITVAPRLVNNSDSAFFYLDVPNANSESFWQSYKMEQYRLAFTNISNLQWYARKKPCANLDFSVEVQKNSGQCTTRLKAINSSGVNTWKIFDAEKWSEFSNQQTLDLPDYISPNATITLSDQTGCIITKRLTDFPDYLKNKQSCASAATLPGTDINVMVYPNPSTGIFTCKKDGAVLFADNISVFNSSGIRVAYFTNTHTFNIGHLPGGIYLYQVLVNKSSFRGKLVKH
jgi:Secretion system C-terminal sorting domain